MQKDCLLLSNENVVNSLTWEKPNLSRPSLLVFWSLGRLGYVKPSYTPPASPGVDNPKPATTLEILFLFQNYPLRFLHMIKSDPNAKLKKRGQSQKEYFA